MVELAGSDPCHTVFQDADRLDHALGEPVSQRRGEAATEDEDGTRPPQGRVDRCERLGDRLLDDDAPVDSRYRRHCGENRMAVEIARRGLLAAMRCNARSEDLERPYRGLVGPENQADVGMGDQAPRLVQNERFPGPPDPDCRYDIPDELEIDLGDRHTDRGAVTGYGNGQKGL